MITIVSLLALFILLDIAVLAGWAPSTRDSRDWTVPQHDAHANAVSGAAGR